MNLKNKDMITILMTEYLLKMLCTVKIEVRSKMGIETIQSTMIQIDKTNTLSRY